MSHIFEHRSYIIFPVSELNKIDFNAVLETSIDTVRKSVDGTKTFVKWDGEQPSCISDLTNTEGPYTYSEIIDLLAGPDWTSPMSGSMP